MSDYNNKNSQTEDYGNDGDRRGYLGLTDDRREDVRDSADERIAIEERDNVYTPGYTRYQDINRSDRPGRGIGRNDSPYSYDPEKGWQRTDTSTESKYEWNFHNYDTLDVKRKGGRRNRGVIVFTVCLIGVLITGLFTVTAYSLFRSVKYGSSDSQPSTTSSTVSGGWDNSAYGMSSFAGGDMSLELTSKPQINETIPVGEKLTTPEIAKLVSPAVVGVSTHQGTRFYEPVSIGSGIVMSEDGYIITNAHVVTGGAYFKVQLGDDVSFDAILIGADSMTDLAVLKIDQTGLATAIFGDSDELEVGEPVVAIGNPAGMELAGSVTQGIVSALNRMVATSSYTFKYIQTDAAINPGNSGGALVNEYGQVIGINSSKIMAAGYEGIGFAIPITDAKPILDDIIANGRVTGRVMLGITCIPVSDADARDFGVPLGLEIIDILPESDLASKGAQQGDIITKIDGKPVYSNPDVQAVLKDRKPGDTVTLHLYRRVTPVQEIELDIEVRLIES